MAKFQCPVCYKEDHFPVRDKDKNIVGCCNCLCNFKLIIALGNGTYNKEDFRLDEVMLKKIGLYRLRLKTDPEFWSE